MEKHLREQKGIKVHLSKHTCYRTMYEYVTCPSEKKPQSQLDTEPWISPGHPAPEDLPAADPRLQALWRARTSNAQSAREQEDSQSKQSLACFPDVVRHFGNKRGPEKTVLRQEGRSAPHLRPKIICASQILGSGNASG